MRSTCLSRVMVVCSLAVLGSPIMGAPTTRLSAETLRKQKVSLVIMAQNRAAEPLVEHARSYVEGIFRDNDITILDKETARKMTDVNELLKDPSVVITPDLILENQQKYKIGAIGAVYVSADVAAGFADFYTATSQADIRIVDANTAGAQPVSGALMGTPGAPPSDGLTENSALINAVERALDSSCRNLGLEIMDPARARTVSLRLQGPVSFSGHATEPRQSAVVVGSSLVALAGLEQEGRTKEEVSCSATDAGGNVLALGGYLHKTYIRMGRRMERHYGSRVHIVDIKNRRKMQTLQCHDVSPPGHTVRVLDLAFLGNWRYLAGVTGREVFLWDTERGRLMDSQELPQGIKDRRRDKPSASLKVARGSTGTYLVVDAGKDGRWSYRITRAR